MNVFSVGLLREIRELPVAFVTAELGGALCGPTRHLLSWFVLRAAAESIPVQRTITLVAMIGPRILQLVRSH